MRLSSDSLDPGYHPAAIGFVRVFLDGEELRDCITADEERGWALVNSRDAAGKHIIRGGELQVHSVTGHIEIQIDPAVRERIEADLRRRAS